MIVVRLGTFTPRSISLEYAMYNWSFYDLDGHYWEVLWMDPNHVP